MGKCGDGGSYGPTLDDFPSQVFLRCFLNIWGFLELGYLMVPSIFFMDFSIMNSPFMDFPAAFDDQILPVAPTLARAQR